MTKSREKTRENVIFHNHLKSRQIEIWQQISQKRDLHPDFVYDGNVMKYADY